MEYTLVRSARRSLAVQIKPDGKVIVRANYRTSLQTIENFLSAKSAWIKKHLAEIAGKPALPKFTEEEIKNFIVSAKAVIPSRVAYFASVIGVSYGKTTIRRARTLWGSCTVKGNLNFNCLLVCLPNDVCDYVIIHELCHRKQMNHSPKFWALVSQYCPEYKTRRKWLKTFGAEYLGRL